jgi:hypothetical protein
MKRVKANGAFMCNQMPDDIFVVKKAEMELLKKTNMKQFVELAALGKDYPDNKINPGQEATIPNWQYDIFKDMKVTIGVSFDQFKQKGGRIPFAMNQAQQFGLVADNETTKEVQLIELIEDLDVEELPVIEEKKTKKQ